MKGKGHTGWTSEQLAEFVRKGGKAQEVLAGLSGPGARGTDPMPPHSELMKMRTLMQKRRRRMNKTEASFARLLEAMKARGEIVGFEFEGITLRYGNEEQFQSTPDFAVIVSKIEDHVKLRFYECKGAHVRNAPAAMQRFKHARDNHPHYEFELWIREKGEWIRRA